LACTHFQSASSSFEKQVRILCFEQDNFPFDPAENMPIEEKTCYTGNNQGARGSRGFFRASQAIGGSIAPRPLGARYSFKAFSIVCFFCHTGLYNGRLFS